ncbi:MAG TPA: Jag N-terminal domain-containing protein [Thermodesulfobacteriota bacterium]|jgi:spoIIIJ-associated protein|nr:Jag N-terminal domain-containing protein [Thermodesulfobacteriota bacterium]
MPIVIEREGKTVSEAIISVCEELGLPRDELIVEVLEEGSRGVLGIGGKNAKVRVTVKREGISEKGLRAKKALETVLGFFVPSYSTSLKETPDRIKLDVKLGENKGLLIGRRGEMLRAMEFIIGKIAGRACRDGKEKRVSIDVEGYKKRRESNISKMVREAAKRARRSGRPVTLEPMSAFERRIAYMALKHEDGIKFETKVEGEDKRIIITPQRRNGERNRHVSEKKA